MSEVLSKLAECIEFGKINKASPFPPQMKGEDGADELTRANVERHFIRCGTQVWLNSGTMLKYARDFGENSRKILLDGEAYFKVKKGEIPFKVQLKTSENRSAWNFFQQIIIKK